MIASFALGSFDGAGLHCVTYDFDTSLPHLEVSSQATAGFLPGVRPENFTMPEPEKAAELARISTQNPCQSRLSGSSSGSLVTRSGYL